MGNQSLTFESGRRVSLFSEYNVRTECVRFCAKAAGRLHCLRVGMDSHIAEVVSEARLHQRSRGGVERLTGGVRNLVDGREGRRLARAGFRASLNDQLLRTLGAWSTAAVQAACARS